MSSEHLSSLLHLAMSSGLGLFVAWRLGFFRWVHTVEPWSVSPSGGQVLTAFIIYLGMQLFILPSIAVGFVTCSEGASQVNHELSRPAIEGWINFIGIALSLPVLIWYSLYSGCTLWERRTLSSWQRIGNIAFGVVVWLVAFPLVTLAAEGVKDLSRLLVEGPPLDQVAVRHLKETYGDPLLVVLSTIAIFAFVPIIEELLFRGFLQNWLKVWMGPKRALLTTAIAFTIVHFSPSQGVANAELMVGLFLLALFLGFLYERQQCLWPCIGLHCCFNAISVTMILLGFGTE